MKFITGFIKSQNVHNQSLPSEDEEYPTLAEFLFDGENNMLSVIYVQCE